MNQNFIPICLKGNRHKKWKKNSTDFASPIKDELLSYSIFYYRIRKMADKHAKYELKLKECKSRFTFLNEADAVLCHMVI